MRNYGTAANSVKKESLAPVESLSPDRPQNSTGIDSDLPPMPDGMDEGAQTHWHFIGRKLLAAGHISSADYTIMRIYCETYSLYLQAQKKVAEEGEYFTHPLTGVPHIAPWATLRGQYAATIHKLEQKLFLTPQARKGVKHKAEAKTLELGH